MKSQDSIKKHAFSERSNQSFYIITGELKKSKHYGIYKSSLIEHLYTLQHLF